MLKNINLTIKNALMKGIVSSIKHECYISSVEIDLPVYIKLNTTKIFFYF